MKKIILYLLLPFTFLQIYAQSKYFSKSYKLPNSQYSRAITKCKDGLLLLSETHSKAFTEVIKTDFDGNIIWKKSRAEWVAKDMKLIKDTIYYASWNVSDTEGKDDILFHAMTTDGDSIYTRYLGTDEYEEVNSFQPTEDGGFIFITTRDWDKVDINQDKLIIFKIDKNGKFQWEKHIGKETKLHDVYSVVSFQKMPNDEYLAIYQGYEQGEYKNLMTKIKGDGSFTMYNKEFYNLDVLEAGINLKAISGNRFFGLMAWNSPSSFDLTKFPSRMVIMDKNLNYLKKGTIFHDTFPAIAWDFHELPSGDFIACGDNRNTDTSYHITEGGYWLSKYDKEANLKWERIIIDWRYVAGDLIKGFCCMTPLDNGDIVAMSDTRLWNDPLKNDLWLLRVDSMGCPKPNCKGRLQNITHASTALPQEMNKELPNVKLFPNPTYDELWLELYDESYTNRVKISIFDMMGHLLAKKKLENTDSIFKIDVSNLSKGTYLIKIENDDGKFSIQKFVKL